MGSFRRRCPCGLRGRPDASGSSSAQAWLNNIFAKRLETINVSALNKFEDGATVNVCDLLEQGILSKCEYGVKVLGNGEITKKLTVRASAFSASAKEKIEKAGGTAEVI